MVSLWMQQHVCGLLGYSLWGYAGQALPLVTKWVYAVFAAWGTWEGVEGGNILWEEVYLLIHMHTSGAGQASIERWCLLIDHLAPRNIRFVLHVCDCGHWDQIVSTNRFAQSYRNMIWPGQTLQWCLRERMRPRSCKGQGYLLKILWQDYRMVRRWYQTQNTFVMAWLILWGRKVNPGRMRYYIRFDVDVEGKSSASLHLSGVSTCTFQGGRRDLPPKYWWTGYIVVSVLELV